MRGPSVDVTVEMVAFAVFLTVALVAWLALVAVMS